MKWRFKTLDVGCGARPQGDVNMDVHRHKGILNFVLADAHHLPFRSEAFELVYCSHVLEHCEYPYQVLKEIKLVTNDVVVIKVPNMGVWDTRDSTHLYSWSKYSFQKLLERHFRNVNVSFGMHFLNRPLLRKYTLIKRILSVIDYLASYVLLHFIKNELVAVCYKN